MHTAPSLTTGTVYGRFSRPRRRRIYRVAAATAEVLLAVAAGVAYGTLGSIVHTSLTTAGHHTAAGQWIGLVILVGVSGLAVWGRSAIRRRTSATIRRFSATEIVVNLLYGVIAVAIGFWTAVFWYSGYELLDDMNQHTAAVWYAVVYGVVFATALGVWLRHAMRPKAVTR